MIPTPLYYERVKRKKGLRSCTTFCCEVVAHNIFFDLRIDGSHGMADAPKTLIKPEHEAVLSTTVIGCMSTLRCKDQRISTNPISFLWNGSEFEISTLKGRMKYRNLASHPQATLCVVSALDPMHYVEVRGNVRLVDDPDRALFTAHFRRVSGGIEPPDGMDPPDAERAMIYLTPEQVSSPAMYGGQFDDFADKFHSDSE